MTNGDCERCHTAFTGTMPHQRFCSARRQRAAERARYRARHVERAVCRGCGAPFTRTATSSRLKVYCSPACMRASRSAEYANRPDILATLDRARRARGEAA
jgi:hypothetical protein